MINKYILFTIFIAMARVSNAHPVEIETTTAKIIVIRPAEQWTPDSGVMDDFDAGSRSKKYLLRVQDTPGVYTNGSTQPIGWMALAVKNMEEAGWESSRWLPKNINNIGPTTTVTGAQFNEIIDAQERIYKARVLKYGSPEMQKSSFNRGTLVGYALTIGTLGLGAKIGIPTNFLGLTTGVAELVGSIPPALLSAISPNWPANGDFSSFNIVDIRRVTSNEINNKGVVGQIIIAYKTDKTPQLEEMALVMATRALVGVDRLQSEVDKSRNEDYSRRSAIWNECVASRQCNSAD